MKSKQQVQNWLPVQRLMLLRVVVVSFLLGIAALIQFRLPYSLSASSIHSIYIITGLTYLLSICYVLLLKLTKNVSLNVYIQSTLDVFIITLLVYCTGGVESVYSSLYTLVVIYSVLFLGRKGGMFVASASSILYGLLADFEFYGVITPLYSATYQYTLEGGQVILRICIHIASFYIVASLASFLVEREIRTQNLLSEKESAFDQLDILHKSIIESVGSGIMTVDLAGRVKTFNRAAESISGIKPKDAINRNVDHVFPGFSRAVERAEKGNGLPTRRREIEVPLNNNDKILGFSIYPLIDQEENGIGRIFIFQDLTSFKEMEVEIEKNRRLALMGEMSAILAHELRTPLSSMGGSIKLLMEDLHLGGSDRRLMEIILKGRDQMECLVKEFLIFARPDNPDRSNADLNEIFTDILEGPDFYSNANENIEVIRKLSANGDVYGNGMQIRQVLWNVILNSLQAMPDGGRLEIETKSGTGRQGRKNLIISISDNGLGIEKKDMDRMLEPFYTTKEKGTGLGLAIVNRIIESHGGKIHFESKPAMGTRCIIALPVSRPEGE